MAPSPRQLRASSAPALQPAALLHNPGGLRFTELEDPGLHDRPMEPLDLPFVDMRLAGKKVSDRITRDEVLNHLLFAETFFWDYYRRAWWREDDRWDNGQRTHSDEIKRWTDKRARLLKLQADGYQERFAEEVTKWANHARQANPQRNSREYLIGAIKWALEEWARCRADDPIETLWRLDPPMSQAALVRIRWGGGRR